MGVSGVLEKISIMIRFPNAKINLGLHVVRRRTDNFHDLETVFYPVPLRDILEITPAERDASCFVNTGLSVPGDSANNLCMKALSLLSEDFDIPVSRVHLHKVIPFGSGLGGGSSDAAFVIEVLNEMYKLGLNEDEKLAYASKLGSDCAFFIRNEPCFATGRGEILETIDVSLEGYFLVIVLPPVHVSTAEAFSGIKPAEPTVNLREAIHRPVTEWMGLVSNDFEKSIFPRFPMIHKLKEQLLEKGAIYASMSGSGSSVFGIFRNKPSLVNDFKGLFYWEGML
jgi:4-diphosphocytidyl-2-C-methyl-D-erythritol kinase